MIKNYKTEYKQLGLSLHPNTKEVCYFEISDWIKNELGFDEVGRIWYKRCGFTLFAGMAEIKEKGWLIPSTCSSRRG